jgi:putative transposase
MPWNETEPMNERVKCIARYLQRDEPVTAPCERVGVSRKTGYKCVKRYDAGGVAALIDPGRRRHIPTR